MDFFYQRHVLSVFTDSYLLLLTPLNWQCPYTEPEMTSHCLYLFSPNHLQEESSSVLHHSMFHFLFCMCSMMIHSDTNQQGKPVGLTDWTNRHAGKMNEVKPYQYNCSSNIKIDGNKNLMRQS